MKNFHKVVMSLAVGAMAIGFSAFTNAKSHKLGLTDYTFTHPAHSTSNLPSDYVYHANPAGCNESSDICKSVWSQSTAPAEGSAPASGATQISVENGDYR